ncbi:hypothetical protein [Candidatus Binatus sp.]|uniref:hypothetical protein n=1 Tax=Candidatus Binatus sp. TaxID=2811406 RepID=UPI003C99CB45
MIQLSTTYTHHTRVLAFVIGIAIAFSSSDARSTTLLPPESSTTSWSVASDHKTILLSVNGAAAIPFVIKGVDYSPRPINDAALTIPGSDYFWGDPAHLTYGPIWIRDLWGATYNDNFARVNLPDGLVRQLGANSIRTYAWWKWVPMSPADYSKWNELDWSVSPRVRFGATTAPAGFAGWPAHDGGDQFLDLCWNHGVNPIYVVIGISVDPWLAFPGANPDPVSLLDERMFIERTTKWLAQRYGYHPAVIGFAIGNETNLPFARGTDRYIDYWQYLNHLGVVAKHYAPDKLTMTAFADYPTGETPMLLKPLVAFKNGGDAHSGALTIPVCVDQGGENPSADCSSAHRRRAYPADIYALDVWGFNAYRRPETEDVANFKRWIVDGHYTNGSEIGTELPNPAPKPIILTEWGAPASIRTRDGQPPPPPNPQWVSASPAVADEFHGAPGYRAARLIQQIASDIYGPRSTLSTTGGGILSGGYVFEFQDEWWKEAQHQPETWSSHDTTILTSMFPFGEPGAGFSSYWDEEWFGLMSVATSAGRRPDSPVLLTAEHGERSLNGGADVLTPRAGFYALQEAFKGETLSPEPIVNPNPTKLIPISFPSRK